MLCYETAAQHADVSIVDRTEQILRELIGFDSSHGHEASVGQYLVGLLEPEGFRIRQQPVSPASGAEGAGPRFNVIAERGEPRLYFFGHLDTVRAVGHGGEPWTHPPLRATERNGRLYGLGAVDMKGGIAAFLGAVLTQQPPDIGLCFTCDEEGQFAGIRTLLEGEHFAAHRPELAIFAEPTDLRIIHRHRACFEIAFEARGRAAHAGTPELGCDASQLYTCLSQVKVELRREYPDTDLNIGYFQSGSPGAINVVPERAQAVIDVRPSSELHPRGVGYVVERVEASARELGLTLEHHVNIDMKPLEVSVEQLEPLCEAVRQAGLEIRLARLDGTSEAGEAHHRLGVPCVHFGPGPQSRSHQVDEYVDLEMLAKTEQVYRALIESYQR